MKTMNLCKRICFMILIINISITFCDDEISTTTTTAITKNINDGASDEPKSQDLTFARGSRIRIRNKERRLNRKFKILSVSRECTHFKDAVFTASRLFTMHNDFYVARLIQKINVIN